MSLTTPPQVEKLQTALHAKAKAAPAYRFYALYDKVYRQDILAHAYQRCHANQGAAGVNGENFQDIEVDGVERWLAALSQELQDRTYQPKPVQRVWIPKSDGAQRPLGIPTIRDRVVQMAVVLVLEPIFEADLPPEQFAYRPERSAQDAAMRVRELIRTGYTDVVDADLSGYFDTINHRKLMKLLRRRVDDEKLLGLIWNFLRSGVMERNLFKDTTLGTPQGGIVSPLLANVYLHELDLFMKSHCDFDNNRKHSRRRKGLANFVYARYADDFVILCNGTKEQTLEMRVEVHNYLRDNLHLMLSMEKTKVTHLNDGFDFLGFRLKRCMGGKGMVTKILIPEKALEKHRGTLRAALAPNTCDDSIGTKLMAVNRIIGGWCRYFQYAGVVAKPFAKMQTEAFWLFAHWLGRKHKMNMTEVMRTYYAYRTAAKAKVLGYGDRWLARHLSYKAKRYHASPFKPNPYTTLGKLEREEQPDDNPWLGNEARPGMADLRLLALERDEYRCCKCMEAVTASTAQVDHKRPVSRFKRPADANHLLTAALGTKLSILQ